MAKLDVDIELIEKLADLMADKGLTELVVEEDDTKLRLQRGGGAPVYAAGPAPAPVAVPSAAATATTAAETAGNHPGAIKAPMVGTAYLSPQPGAANFVSVGAKVAAGDTVLIIEAMKVMNQIPAPKAGTVTQILVADGEPVEFGEALLVIE
jgi:acetyl-CoA carboxylase biotin carboxyl carrier protein